MRIALFGYGKMGKMIEQIAQQRNHMITAKIDIGTTEINYSDFDVAIDFSTPDAAFENIRSCFENKVPVISGTTGWLDKYEEAVTLCNENGTGFIYASNFSLGVNIFFELNAYLAGMMKNLDQYSVSMQEIHHTQKLDAPSGTAITLAEGIIEKTKYKSWNLDGDSPDSIPINSEREGQVPGTHRVFYKSDVDTITIEHLANNREGFALGAVIAAEWILGKTGVFSMRDVLNLG
ncbi:MAG: 4-hydroxy-tetrahydrodipicolinate reductase [Flavobacteriaceae bacterium]